MLVGPQACVWDHRVPHLHGRVPLVLMFEGLSGPLAVHSLPLLATIYGAWCAVYSTPCGYTMCKLWSEGMPDKGSMLHMER